jgi:hypothetical protein
MWKKDEKKARLNIGENMNRNRQKQKSDRSLEVSGKCFVVEDVWKLSESGGR